MQVPKEWHPYTRDKNYLQLSTDLISPTESTLTQESTLIRDDLYKMWNKEETPIYGCQNYFIPTKDGAYVTDGNSQALDRCFKALDNSSEYTYLGNHFLIEYENCLKLVDEENFHSSLTTICLDTIAIRRMIIEYNLCCGKNSSVITSTLCEFKNFNTMYLDHNLSTLNYLANEQTPLVSSVEKLCSTHSLAHFLCIFYIVHLCWAQFYLKK